MTLKPPTRTLPKLVKKEWPIPAEVLDAIGMTEDEARREFAMARSLSDFTRVVEETGVLQKEAPLTKRESKHD